MEMKARSDRQGWWNLFIIDDKEENGETMRARSNSQTFLPLVGPISIFRERAPSFNLRKLSTFHSSSSGQVIGEKVGVKAGREWNGTVIFPGLIRWPRFELNGASSVTESRFPGWKRGGTDPGKTNDRRPTCYPTQNTIACKKERRTTNFPPSSCSIQRERRRISLFFFPTIEVSIKIGSISIGRFGWRVVRATEQRFGRKEKRGHVCREKAVARSVTM